MDILQQVQSFESKLSYNFKDKALLTEALTHKSFSNENCHLNLNDNERFEFLGDAVLDLVISELLFKLHKDMPEGELSKKRSSLVREETLNDIALEIGLGEHILLGRGEEQTGGRNKKSLLANCLEALIASVYLDGGFDNVYTLVETLFSSRLASKSVLIDFKSEFQEKTQKDKKGQSKYSVTAEEGPDHDKMFFVSLDLDGDVIASGEGKNIKEAEQMAAKKALLKLYDIEQ